MDARWNPTTANAVPHSTTDTPQLIQINGRYLVVMITLGTRLAYAHLRGTAMTSASDIQSPLGLGGIEALRAKRGWIIALGIIYVIAGLIALGSVVMATVVSGLGPPDLASELPHAGVTVG